MELSSWNSDERQAKKGKWDRPTSMPPISSTNAEGDRARDAVSPLLTGSGHHKEAMGLYTDFRSQASGPKEMRGEVPAQQGGMRECLSLLQWTLPGSPSMPGTG